MANDPKEPVVSTSQLVKALSARHTSHTKPVVGCTHCKRAAADVARMMGR